MQKTRERRITRVRVCVSRATLILLKQCFNVRLSNWKIRRVPPKADIGCACCVMLMRWRRAREYCNTTQSARSRAGLGSLRPFVPPLVTYGSSVVYQARLSRCHVLEKKQPTHRGASRMYMVDEGGSAEATRDKKHHRHVPQEGVQPPPPM